MRVLPQLSHMLCTLFFSLYLHRYIQYVYKENRIHTYYTVHTHYIYIIIYFILSDDRDVI